jgi:hypothetical protein
MQTTAIPKMSLDTDYGIGEAAFLKIVSDIASLGPKAMVEFGAGNSSFRFAEALPNVDILSIDHDKRFFGEAQEQLKTMMKRPEKLRVELRPLHRQRFGCYVYTSYGLGRFPDQVDAVLVDGPPYWVRRGREACLHQIAPFLRVGARIYLDDTNRSAESQISNNWLRAYPTLTLVDSLNVGHGVHVFEVSAPLGRPKFDVPILMDHMGALVSEFRGMVSDRLRRKGATRAPRITEGR